MTAQDDTAVDPDAVKQLGAPHGLHAMQADTDEFTTGDETGWCSGRTGLGVSLGDASSQQSFVASAPHYALDTEHGYRACVCYLSQHSCATGHWLRSDSPQDCRHWRAAR